MIEFELTSPRPDQSPQTEAPHAGSRVFDWSELDGKTIQFAMDYPAGRHAVDVDAVIVCTDGSWLTVAAESDGCGEESASINLGDGRWSRQQELSDYLSPNQLLQAGVINQGQHQFMVNRENEQKKKDALDRAARLRAEADKLEGGAA